jgi:hypothetical protein
MNISPDKCRGIVVPARHLSPYADDLGGAVAANAVLYPRVIVATAILNPAVELPLAIYLAAPAVAAALIAGVGSLRPTPAEGKPDMSLDNPLQLAGALQMAVLFQGC